MFENPAQLPHWSPRLLLGDGYHDLPEGKLAAVVTYLEMRTRVGSRPEREEPRWTLRHAPTPSLGWYRALYRRVGESWLWSCRLVMPDAALAAILNDPAVEVHAMEVDGVAEGILELDFRVAGECEIGFFGLSPALVGQGGGRWLMNRAIARAWSRPITRFWLHTCSLDAPAALPFYLRSGFIACGRRVEVFDDPRLLDALPPSAMPQQPIISSR
jgi:GNAT superfamily N-acetyltransferase